MSRQAISLLLGGLKERIEGCRRPGVTFAAFVALTVAATALVGIPGGRGGSVDELEEYACVHAQDPASPSGEPRRRSTTWECTRT